MTFIGIPDYVRATGGPEAVFARARRVELAEREERRAAIVAAYPSRDHSGCRPGCVPCARSLPRDGQVYMIDGAPYAHVPAPQLRTQ